MPEDEEEIVTSLSPSILNASVVEIFFSIKKRPVHPVFFLFLSKLIGANETNIILLFYPPPRSFGDLELWYKV